MGTRLIFAVFVALLSLLAVDGASARTLSDETTFTRWAYTAERAKVRARPAAGRVITRLRFRTEDDLPELYTALRSKTVGGTEWVRIRLPRRPNNSTGWVPRSALGPWRIVRKQLVIDRSTLRVTLYDQGRRVMSARIGIGKSSTPTPRGRFYIREKLHGFNSPVYGPRVMATSAYAPTLSDWPGGGIIGLHGTNQPGLLPGRPSHGCVRMRNGDIIRLYKRVPLGTPVLII